ncbi:Poly-glutamine tract binding protein 1 [Strongyloides ratti]|uniref:Poly-glutamine tract binding protein 1 n=1 Tax=Strongyloides ratti TaxID=34506 RepID=A0A090LN65_STRRB|nr:Poly-glutamine tract binding protein 1 [Strongyloides ratti]CEF71285.1 Poly-glutamine tract binding protein 1 [Strongyloides ratti]
MAKFYCETHGNPKPRIYWRKSDDLQVRANDTVFVNHESISTLSCEFHGYPKPGDIIWTFNGENIITGKPSKRFNVIQIDKNYGVDSKLIIYNLESKNPGNNNCTASTVYTIVTATISLCLYTFITNSIGVLTYNKAYESINQNNPALDFNNNYGKGYYQSSYQVTFITTDINLSYATTILRYDGNTYVEIITPDNESGTPLLVDCDNNINQKDILVRRISAHL